MEFEASDTLLMFSAPEAEKKVIDKEYFDHIRKINDVFYDQIKIADQKAAYIFTFMIAFLVSSADVRGVFSLGRYMQPDIALAIASAVLAVAVAVAMVSAILVVLPRRVARSTSLFWGTWAVQRETFRAAAEANDASYLFEQYTGNADTLAMIAAKKYRFVALAFRTLVLAVIAYLAVLGFA